MPTIQLTLEHGFELCRSTYMCVFSIVNTPGTTQLAAGNPQTWKCRHGGLTIHYTWISTYAEGQCP